MNAREQFIANVQAFLDGMDPGHPQVERARQELERFKGMTDEQFDEWRQDQLNEVK